MNYRYKVVSFTFKYEPAQEFEDFLIKTQASLQGYEYVESIYFTKEGCHCTLWRKPL